MGKELSIKSLLEKFPQTSRRDWLKVANSETGYPNTIDKLTWRGTNELSFAPYYDQNDQSVHRVPENFQLSPSHENFLGPQSWKNMPPVNTHDEVAANGEALMHLQHGADGILFICNKQTDFTRLLQSIQPDYCQLSFQLENDLPAKDLFNYLKQHSTPRIKPSLLWKKKLGEPERIFSDQNAVKNISVFGIFVQQHPDPVTEIVEALLEGIKILDKLTDCGFSSTDVLRHISFSFEASGDFFLSYAKLKAFRILWFQVAHAYGASSFHWQDCFLHVRSEAGVKEKESFNPHGAMLKATTSAVSAICGGCDAVTIIPEDLNNPMMVRVARNVSNILREEAHLHAVADPFAGSYFAEALVHRIASHAWKKFQNQAAE